MKYIVELNNKTKYKFAKKNLKHIFEKTVEMIGEHFFAEKKIKLSVALVAEEEIFLLNRQYRKKNSATDVLSFAEYEKSSDLHAADLQIGEEEIFIGELIVCPDYVNKNAIEDGETFEYAMTYIISHGILHLLGLSHGKKMFAMQQEVAKKLVSQKVVK